MNRRGFLGLSLAAVGGIFVPKYDKWYRQGSGLLTPRVWSGSELNAAWIKAQMAILDNYGGFEFTSFDADGFTLTQRGTSRKYYYRIGTFDIPTPLQVVRA